jgi:cyanophycinase-like exopeptidase
MKINKVFIQELINNRDKFRKQGKFREADEIRKKIKLLGYDIRDEINETKMTLMKSNTDKAYTKQFLVLFGSGEMSSVGRSTFDHVLKEINKKSVKISIITTPAGFQPNVVTVHEEISDFINRGLRNYHPNVSILYANDFNKANNPSITGKLDGSDIIFMGPGSPTYTVRHLKNTLLLEKIIQSLKNKTSLILSSAAVIAFSRFTLPVYEIYKVGSQLYWEKGLDLFSTFIHETSFIPHCNNKEGMPKTDTSYCYMGKDRFTKLRSLLPPDEQIVGIDEQTAYVIDLISRRRLIIGKGNIHHL